MNPFFAAFLADEPPKCQRLWGEVLGLAERRGVDLFGLPAMLESPDLPAAVHWHVVVILNRLADLGSLRRFDALVSLADAVDEIDADPEVRSLIVFAPKEEDT